MNPTTVQSPWELFDGGTLHIICSSHNDIAWFDTPAATMSWRADKSITPALERMAQHQDVRFSMENVLYLLEYLEHHPDRKEEIHRLVLDKRFDWGATYNQPYESLLSGEQLVRQMYYGRKLIRKLLPGVDARVYYSPDVPGRAMQMPQILAKAGVPYMLISRHKPSLQHWYSPDGSRVLSWSMGHYGDTCLFSRQLDGSFERVLGKIQADLQQWSAEYSARQLPPHYAYLYSMDYIPPKDFDGLIGEWNAEDDSGIRPPHMQYSTPEQFFDIIAASDADLEAITGERPNIWLYIDGPTHHRAISAKRAAAVVLPAAETFAVIDAVLAGDYSRYPARQLDSAWTHSIYDDHGWGGNNGHITDDVFHQKIEAGRALGERLLTNALESLARRIRTQPAKGTPLTVFNPLSWDRTEPVHALIPAQFGPFQLIDSDGHTVSYQIVAPTTGLDTEVVFIAENVPSVGYKTFYAREGQPPQSGPQADVSDTVFENAYYRLELASGGIKRLWDKEQGREVFKTEKYLGAEVFMLESVGNGAGEFGSVQQPSDAADFERASKHAPAWEVTASGPIFTEYTLSHQLQYCLLVQRITCYNALKRVDCAVTLQNFNGTKSREFRVAFPLDMTDSKITYEVPMGVLEVGRDEVQGSVCDGPVYSGYSEDRGHWQSGPAYVDDCRDVHPREVLNFICASNETHGFTLSTSVAVCDWVDPRLFPATYPILQPLLLASRKSCHWNGNWYLQAGDHHFTFSLFAHGAGGQAGRQAAVGANHQLLPVAGIAAEKTAALPETHSFARVSADNVVLTALKKADDTDALVARLVEVEGRDTDLELRLSFPIERAEHTNLIEEEGAPVSVEGNALQIRIGHHAIETYALGIREGAG